MNKHVLAVLLIVLLGGIAYYNSLDNEFVYDDASVIVKNRDITTFSNVKDLFTKDAYFARSGVGKYRRYGEGSYRPVVTFTYFIDALIWEKNPLGYHLANVLYHILLIVVLYFLLFRVSQNFGIAIGTSFIACVHPVMTEVVNAISFREDILCAIFFCLGFLFFVMYAQHRAKPVVYLFLMAISYLLACLSKENGFTLPLLIAAYVIFAEHPTGSKKLSLQIHRFGKAYIFLAASAILYLIIRFVLFNFTVDSAPDITLQLMITRFIRFINVIPYYLRITLFPNILPPAFNNDFLHSAQLLAISIPVCLSYIILIYWQRKKGLIPFFLSWFIITLLPMSGLLYLNQPVAVRYLYISMIGITGAVVTSLSPLFKKKILSCSMLTILIIVLSAKTRAQNEIWSTEYNLWSYAMKFSPRDYNTVSNYAIVLADMKRYEEAVDYYKKAIELDDRAQTFYNLANTYSALGRKKEAEKAFRTSIAKDPNYSEAHNNLARILAEEGRYQEALDEATIAVQLNPFNAKAFNNLGGCYNQLKQYEQAKQALIRALQISPGYTSALFNLGTSYYKLGEYDKAIEMMSHVLRYEPNNKAARQYLQSMERQRGLQKSPKGSIQHNQVEQETSQPVPTQTQPSPALTVQTDKFAGRYDAQQSIQQGDAFMNAGRIPQALKMYRIAVTTEPDNPTTYVKLAECYVRLGSFELAHKTILKALELEPDNKQAKLLLSEIQRVLKLPVGK